MKDLNKFIFTFCLLIGCFIFSDKVLAFTLSQEIYEVEASTPESQIFNRYGCSGCSEDKINAKSFDNYMDLVNNNNYSYSKILLGGVIAHPSCRNKSHDLLTPTDNGMPICARDAMNVQASYYETPEDSPEKTNYIDNRTKIIKTYEHISYFVSRLDSYANYQIISDTDWEFSWGLNNKMGVSIYPEMKLKYNIKDKINTENEKWKNRVITGIKIEAVNGNYETYYTQGENQLKNNNTANQLDVYAVRNFTVTQHYNDDNPSVATIDEEGNTTRPSNYTEYSYTINIPKLLANENNGLYGMGYNGTTINNDMLNDTINSDGSYTKNFKGEYNKGQQKQWSFHYLLPLKETITYVVITDKYDECVKDVSLMTSEEKTECCNYNGILKDGKTFAELNPNICYQCKTSREEGKKDEYINKGCCLTDSTNAPAEWCCNNETYFKQKQMIKGVYTPNKKVCCDLEDKNGRNRLFLPVGYNYDTTCPSPSKTTCKKEAYFDNNVDECCEKETKARNKGEKGGYIPNTRSYTKYCEKEIPPKECQTDKDVKRHPISCCKQLENENKIGTDLYQKNCKIKPGTGNSCTKSDTYSRTYNGNEESHTKGVKTTVSDRIEFSEYENKTQTIKSGTGFEYSLTVTNTTTLTVEYPDDTFDSKNEAEESVKDMNDAITNKIGELNKEIKNLGVIYPSQIINFNSDEEVIFNGSNGTSIPMNVVEIHGSEIGTINANKSETKRFYYKTVDPDGTGHTDLPTYPTHITHTNTYKITLPHAYINKSTGKVEYFSNKKDSTNDSTGDYATNYYYGGNKFYTNEHDISKTIDFNITIENGGASGMINSTSNPFTCQTDTYNCIEDEVCCENSPCEKESEDSGYFYRRISLTKPFPDRDPGKNWNGTKNGKSFVNYYIIDRKDDAYKDPMYEITLTPKLINDIRAYNSTTDYFDWNMSGTKCTESNINECESKSRFLSGEESFTDEKGKTFYADFMANEVKFWGEKNTEHSNRTTRYGEDKVIVKGSE